jgi:hypothetical protein
MRHCSVGRVLQLHTLFDNYGQVSVIIQKLSACLPSNGFIKASLAIVAEAPETAKSSQYALIAGRVKDDVPAARG